MTTPEPMHMAELTRERCRELGPDSLLVWPIGSTEQHGPHLPVGTDAIGAEWIARTAAERMADRVGIVLAPTLWLGSSPHHVPFGGTMSLDSETYLRVLSQGLTSLMKSGFQRIFMLNGHGGNHELAQLAARDVALEQDVHIAAGSWWTIAWDALVAAGAADIGRFPGHAGRFETSLLLAMRPELVIHPLPHRDDPGPTTDTRRFGGDYRAEHHGSWQAIDGYGDSPDLADAASGAKWLDVAATVVADTFVEFQRDSGGPVS
jgi:creatinine amidohydrolase